MCKIKGMTQGDIDLIYADHTDLTLTGARKVLRRLERKFNSDPLFCYFEGADFYPDGVSDEQYVMYEDLCKKVCGLRIFVERKWQEKRRV